MTPFDGSECPVCGLSYCTGESGAPRISKQFGDSLDALSWVRVCFGDDVRDSEDPPTMMYVHTDTDVDVIDSDSE